MVEFENLQCVDIRDESPKNVNATPLMRMSLESLNDFLAQNDLYIAQSSKCVEAFNAIRNNVLNDKMKELLLKHDEETAKRESLIQSLAIDYFYTIILELCPKILPLAH